MTAAAGLLKMSELAERSGVSAGTIKHYLREGLLGSTMAPQNRGRAPRRRRKQSAKRRTRRSSGGKRRRRRRAWPAPSML